MTDSAQPAGGSPATTTAPSKATARASTTSLTTASPKPSGKSPRTPWIIPNRGWKTFP